MKSLQKQALFLRKKMRYALTEARLLRSLSHPFLLSLHFAFQTPAHLYLVTDFCAGGDLLFQLQRRRVFTEKEAKFYISELLSALEFLHSRGVFYRDLKPENILLDDEGHVRLADFGLCKEGVGPGEEAFTVCGSPAYMAPEMLTKVGKSKAADLYGIGAILYELLMGCPAHYHHNLDTMFRRIREDPLEFPRPLSPEAKDFISRLMEKDPSHRLGKSGFGEIRDHPFLLDVDFGMIERKEYVPPAFVRLDNLEKEDEVSFKDFDYEEENCSVNRVKNFTFCDDSEESETMKSSAPRHASAPFSGCSTAIPMRAMIAI